MPVMDGVTAALELRKQGVKCPIIALTAKSTGEDVVIIKQRGMDDILFKVVYHALSS